MPLVDDPARDVEAVALDAGLREPLADGLDLVLARTAEVLDRRRQRDGHPGAGRVGGADAAAQQVALADGLRRGPRDPRDVEDRHGRLDGVDALRLEAAGARERALLERADADRPAGGGRRGAVGGAGSGRGREAGGGDGEEDEASHLLTLASAPADGEGAGANGHAAPGRGPPRGSSRVP